MIREFLFKVLIQMYNQKFFFKLKPNKMPDQLNNNIDTSSIKNNGNEKIYINHLKYFHSTKPLLCLRICGVH